MAMDAMIAVKGQKQGDFGGTNPIKGREKTSIVTRVEYQIEAPRDQQSGLSTGKRQHGPVVVTMPLDAAAVQWKTAIATNETLTNVLISFFQPATQGLMQGKGAGVGGEAKAHFTIQLTNAIVQKVEFLHPDTRSALEDVKHREIQLRVSMTFMQITSTWTDGGKTFMDDWYTPQ
jgi:type VI secretion system secreted protein Hcp